MSHAERVHIIAEHLDIVLVSLMLLSFLVLVASLVPARRALRVPTHQALAHRG